MRVKENSYVTIQSFAVNDLKLKGNDLIVFSIIHGFTQDGDNWFDGSLNYLCAWTNATKPTVIKSLNYLVDREIIIKEVITINNVKFCKYKANLNGIQEILMGSKETLMGSKETCMGSKETLMGGSKETLPNNIFNTIDNTINNNINNNIVRLSGKVVENLPPKLKDNYIVDETSTLPAVAVIVNDVIVNEKSTTQSAMPFNEIIQYLNTKCNTNYRSSSNKTQSLIKARLNEGFTLDDFYKVIDIKSIEWINNKEMNKYLRPETLFGTKFESYLNQPMKEMTTKDIENKIDWSNF